MAKTRSEPTATNTVHFACFNCRKEFKQRGSSNWDPDVPKRPFPCPECKRLMTRLGRYVKAPPQRATRQWLKVELLYHYGERFESGYLGLGDRCRTLADTVTYLSSPSRPAAKVRAVLADIRAMRAQKPVAPSATTDCRDDL